MVPVSPASTRAELRTRVITARSAALSSGSPTCSQQESEHNQIERKHEQLLRSSSRTLTPSPEGAPLAAIDPPSIPTRSHREGFGHSNATAVHAYPRLPQPQRYAAAAITNTRNRKKGPAAPSEHGISTGI